MSETLISVPDLEKYLITGKYTQAELAAIHVNANDIYRTLTEGKTPRTNNDAEITLIIGPPAVGKSTLAQKLLCEEGHKAHSVLIDSDVIRSQMQLYQDALTQGKEKGLDTVAADAEAYDKWLIASLYIAYTLLNRAQSDGYNLIRCGRVDERGTKNISERARPAGFKLHTILVHAPLHVAQESIRKRVAAGGHPVNDNYLLNNYIGLESGFQDVTSVSDDVKYYWRARADQGPVLVYEGDKLGHWDIPNKAGYKALMTAIFLPERGMDLEQLGAAFSALKSNSIRRGGGTIGKG